VGEDSPQPAIAELVAQVRRQQEALEQQGTLIAELRRAVEQLGGRAPTLDAPAAPSRRSVDRRGLLRTAAATATGALVAGAASTLGPIARASAAEQSESLGIILPNADDIALYARTTDDAAERLAIRADGTLIWRLVQVGSAMSLFRVPMAEGPVLQAVVDDEAVFNEVPDPVLYLGWNVRGQGGRIDPQWGAAWLQIEADYYADAVGMGLEHATEIHLQLTGQGDTTKTVRAFTTALGGTSGKLASTVAGDFFRIVDSDDTPVVNFNTDTPVFVHRQVNVETSAGGLLIDCHTVNDELGSPQIALRRADGPDATATILFQKGAGVDQWQLYVPGSDLLYLRDTVNSRTQVEWVPGTEGDARSVFADQVVVRRGGPDQSADVLRLADEVDDTLFAVASDGALQLGPQGVVLRVGAGEPDAAVAAPVGSLYLRTDGIKGASLYVKESGGDDMGWVPAGATAEGSFVSLARPTRVYDSRPGYQPTLGDQSVLPADTPRTVDLTANSSGVPPWATSVMVNLVATQTLSGSRGWLAIYANGLDFPGTSSLNWSAAGVTVATTTVTSTDAEGTCVLFAGSACDVVVDVIGYFL
jgi:hypothetical protein